MKKHLIALLSLLCLVQILSAQNAEIDSKEARNALLKNVKKVASIGNPGSILCFKETAFPVLTISDGTQSPIAAASLGDGKVVVFGHDGYFFDIEAVKAHDTKTLFANAIRWASGTEKPLVLLRNLKDFGRYLEELGFQVKNIDQETTISDEQLKGVDLIILHPEGLNVDGEINEIDIVKKFIKSGKGGLFAGLGWGWLQNNPGKSLYKDFKANILLEEAGLALVAGSSEQDYLVPSPISPYLNFEAAKNYVLSNDYKTAQKKDFALALGTVMEGIPWMNKESFKIVTDFPVDVEEGTPGVSLDIDIDTKIPDWHGTGLYAPAGANISINVPKNLQGNLQVRIGAHIIDLSVMEDKNADWLRMPRVSLAFDLEKGKNEVFNPVGGLIYIIVPADMPAQIVTVHISGAVHAPYFKLGKTSLEDWISKIRDYPAEYGEIEGEELVLTVESKHLRNLENPEEIAVFWDKIQAENRKLADWKKGKPHKMRIVFDRQFSIDAFMYAGYPIMALIGDEEVNPQAEVLNIRSPHMKWGFVHELGHNHQHEDWTFEGTGEVTCNLFSVYALEKVMGITGERAHEALAPKFQKNLWRDYVKNGKPFKKWDDEPFLALGMYLQLQQYYGWESFEKVFAAYNKLKDDARPKDDDQKRDIWLTMYSRTVGENLSEFFQVWNVPTSESARESLSDLPKADLAQLMGE